MKNTILLSLFLAVVVNSLAVCAGEMTNSNSSQSQDEYSAPWFTTNKSHQYLGLGALMLGSLTAIAPKPNANDYKDSLHYKLALGATYLGGAAVGTGFVFHYKDLSLKNMFHNPDNLHAMFATVGALGFLWAINIAPDESHTTPGIVGLAGMATAVKITW